MPAQLTKILQRSLLDSPDEVRRLGSAEVRLANFGDTVVGLITLPPGWKWSKDLKPLVGTNSCQASHTQYVISGRMAVRMEDGTQAELKAGDAVIIPPGHDAWVVGEEPFVAVDFTGMKNFAQVGRGRSPEEFTGSE